LENKKCVDSCNAVGYYLASPNCLKCDITCTTCNGGLPTQCSTCSGTLNFKDGACTNNCGIGFFPSSNVCTLCHPTCLTCITGSAET